LATNTNQNEYNPKTSTENYSSKNPIQSQPNVSITKEKEKDRQQSGGLM